MQELLGEGELADRWKTNATNNGLLAVGHVSPYK